MLMLVPRAVGRPHRWGGHTRDGQRPQPEAAKLGFMREVGGDLAVQDFDAL
jgi:hypothetical protein